MLLTLAWPITEGDARFPGETPLIRALTMQRSIKPTCLLIAICLLGGSLLYAAVSTANDDVAGQLIGLCYRDGSSSVVLEEILKAEGVPYIRLRNLDRLETLNLKGLVLGEGFDSSVDQLKKFTEKGGVLLSLKPAGRLAEALGLKEVGVQEDGYLAVEGKGASLVSYEGRLQLFGQSKLYEGGENLARLDPQTRFGGIIKVKQGSTAALVVAFDLPTTLLTIMQPEAECGKFIDASNVEYDLGDVPQVDLMRRLIVGLFLEPIDVPLMRKWYFPSRYKAMLVITGDQDGATFKMMEVVLDLIKELEAPYTLYILQGRSPITREQFDILAEGGMEFALHPNFFKRDGIKFSEKTFNEELKKAEADVGHKLTGERPHSGRWDSVRELPVWCERAGVQYDSILGIKWWESKPAKDGYWVGTGLPYRFIHPDGYRPMDVLEIMVFEGDNNPFWKPRKYTVRYKPGAHKTFMGGLGLTEDEAFELWKPFFDQAIEKYPTAYCYCWHPCYLAAKKLKLKKPPYYRTDTHFRKCVTYAKSRGVGLTGTNALNDFWRAREKVLFKHITWNPESSTVQYRVSSDVKLDCLTLITPLRFHGKKARISVSGRPKDYTETRFLGKQQAMFTVDVRPKEELLVTVKYDY